MVKYNHIDAAAPLASAFIAVHQNTIATIISYGALAGITSVILVLLMGQSRVFFAMSRDGLLPACSRPSQSGSRRPYRTTLLTGAVVAALTFLLSLKTLAELVNIGTLFAFVLVSIGVIFLRRSRPDLQRPFRVPLMPVIPILSVLASAWLMLNLQAATWLRFLIWMAIGLLIYFSYSVGTAAWPGRGPGRPRAAGGNAGATGPQSLTSDR